MTGPKYPVVIVNPRSGGGKAERLRLVAESRARGIEPVVLEPGDDLLGVAHAVVADGADAIGVAGGDGSQALVGAVACERDIAFVCIPAGTRNHFAFDIGVDRADVVGALDAFAYGTERRIDLGRVNGRAFVNNASLGVYATIVQSAEYRDAKVETIARMLPELLPPRGAPSGLAFGAPDGSRVEAPQLVLVSNDAYRMPRPGQQGARGGVDEGLLGVIAVRVADPRTVMSLIAAETGAVAPAPGWLAFKAAAFTVEAAAPVNAALDGEACVLDPPLRFESLPGALRVLVLPKRAPRLGPRLR